MQRLLPLLALAAPLALAPAAVAQTPFDLTEVQWTLGADPGGELLHLEMVLEPLHDRDRVVLRMPWWRPGSYDYSRYEDQMRDLKVVDGTGAERTVEALDDRTWQVNAVGAAKLVVRYDLVVRDMSDDGQPPAIHLHSPAVFLYTEDTLRMPHTIRFELPQGWEQASGLRPHPLREGVYYSPDYDVFVDCPLVLGDFERHHFESFGVPFEVVLFGKKPNEQQMPRADWVETVKKISEAGHQIAGEYPFERYVYLFGFGEGGGGWGLEHLNSTSIVFNHRIIKQGMFEPLESVTAHEFIHLWNVKRIRPHNLGPFDYSTDVRTRDLWWMEGITSYYNDVMVQRAGLRGESAEWFLQSQVQNQQNLARSQGYGVISAERASWTVWDGRQRVSYYDQGQALGWLIDIQIRHHTGNQRSLDDVMRALTRWIDYPGPGLQQDDLERMVRTVSGWDCAEFFDRYVAGNAKYPYAEVLPLAGLRVISYDIGDPYLGIAFDEGLAVAASSAQGDLRTGDVLVGIEDAEIQSTADIVTATQGLRAGEEVTLHVLRAGERVDVSWNVRERDRSRFAIVEDPNATPDQRAILEGILTGYPQAI